MRTASIKLHGERGLCQTARHFLTSIVFGIRIEILSITFAYLHTNDESRIYWHAKLYNIAFRVYSKSFLCWNIWAASWQNQQNYCASSEDSDQPGHSPSLISLDQSLLYAQWVAKDTSFLHADSEDSDETWRMPLLIRIFVGRTVIL